MIIKDNIKGYNFYVLELHQFGLSLGKNSTTTSCICKCEFNDVLSQELQVVINIISYPSFLKFSFISALGNRFESFPSRISLFLCLYKGLILCNLKEGVQPWMINKIQRVFLFGYLVNHVFLSNFMFVANNPFDLSIYLQTVDCGVVSYV